MSKIVRTSLRENLAIFDFVIIERKIVCQK